VDLTTITASNTPVNTTLTWHTATPATDANKIAAGDLATRPAGTYFAAFFDATNNCYSGTGSATTSVTATVNLCPVNLSNSCPESSSVDLEDFFQGTVPDDFELTFHSGTPATDANKLSSSVVSSSGTYFGAFYLSATQCYTATGRPLVVTIVDCCETQLAPVFDNN
jgi:hypothetical protein